MMSDYKYEAIEIVGIAEEDIVKKTDETMYEIPFMLNKSPHTLWELLLAKRWEASSSCNLYCENERIVIENPDLKNLDHLRSDALKPIVDETNRDFEKLIANTKVKTNAIFR